MMRTKVINIFGGPGAGKSSQAAGVYHLLKLDGINCELVREYVKHWAWQGKIPNKFEQYYITGKQTYGENRLYGKVDVIVTDSPLLLGSFYEQYYHQTNMVGSSIKEFLKLASESGVDYHNYLIRRNKTFDPNGRYSDEEESKKIDELLVEFLNKENINYTIISDHPSHISYEIVEDFNKYL